MFLKRVVWLFWGVSWLWGGTLAQAALPPQVQLIQRDGYQDVEVRTGLMDYVFSTRGGVLESAYLYFHTYGLQSTELVPEVSTDPATLTRTTPAGVSFPFTLQVDGQADDSLYAFSQGESDETRVELRFTAQRGELTVVKRYVVFNDPYYRVEFDLTLQNTGSAPLELAQGYTLALGVGLAGVKTPLEAYLFDGQRTESIPSQYARFGGVGFLGGGLALFLKNETEGNAVGPRVSLDRGRKLLGVGVDSLSLAPGQPLTHRYLLYAGRWKYLLMEQSGLGVVAGKGTFSQFLVPMIQFLDWLYAKLGSYGWAILVFTLLTRVLLFPLMRQQFHGMAKMREFQPKMTRLRERYPGLSQLRKAHPDMAPADMQAQAKENRERLNKKMMELYQKEGINPLGGCLPSLLQFPILIILWRAILYSAETIHFSPGFLWLKDLSVADPLYLLVGLTVVAMMLQTKLTPTMGTGQQNQMLMWAMPIMMGLFLKDFPAGLWLYYFLTTVLQVLQQAFINWELAQKQAAKVTVKEVQSPEDLL